jgi:hypothetical protein
LVRQLISTEYSAPAIIKATWISRGAGSSL